MKTTHPTTETARNIEKNLTGEDAMAAPTLASPPDPRHAARIRSGAGAGADMCPPSNPSLGGARAAAREGGGGRPRLGETSRGEMQLCCRRLGGIVSGTVSEVRARDGCKGSREALGFSAFVTSEDGQRSLKTNSRRGRKMDRGIEQDEFIQ